MRERPWARLTISGRQARWCLGLRTEGLDDALRGVKRALHFGEDIWSESKSSTMRTAFGGAKPSGGVLKSVPRRYP